MLTLAIDCSARFCAVALHDAGEDRIVASASPDIGRGHAERLPAVLEAVLADAGMAASGKQVKDALARNAVFINGRAAGVADTMNAGELFAPAAARFGRFYMVKLGKKKYHLFVLPCANA